MRNFLVAGALALMASVASADTTVSSPAGMDIKPYIGLERALEAEKNKLYLGATTSLGMLNLKVQTNVVDTAAASWAYTGMDLDLSTSVSDNVSLFMNNDIDKDWKRSETTIGVKVSF